MRFALGLLLVCSAVAVPTSYRPVLNDEAPVLDEDMIAHVNSRRTTWLAAKNDKFDGMTIAQAKGLMGTIMGGPKPPRVELDYEIVDVPASFDSRTQWPDCPSIALVRDQSSCGSCWAFGSTESFNDRLCVATGNKVILAAADVLGCCSFTCGSGCNGGYPPMAWNYFVNHGVVTESCFTYPFAPCAHHVPATPDYPACPSEEYSTPSCNKTCADGTEFMSDKVKAKSTFSIESEEDIMREISTNGPVTAAFTVYADFVSYKSGVYQHVTGQELGGHAIEIVGYGVDNGVKYWTVKNSWNPSWGNGGYFNILRGQNECGIESEVVAGLAA